MEKRLFEKITYKNKVNLGKTYLLSPWWGCYKISEGCKYCFIQYLNQFYLPFTAEENKRRLDSKLAKMDDYSVVFISLTTDMFLEDGDSYRNDLWNLIKNYSKLLFVIITKRPERIAGCLPNDWGTGYDNVIFDITVENQKRADERIPILLNLPCKHKWLTCTPLLEQINLDQYLCTNQIEHVEAGGETGSNRCLKYEWIKNLSEQCKKYKIRFSFKAAGDHFIKEDKELKDFGYCYKSELADSQNLSYYQPLIFYLNNIKIIK